VNILIYTKDHCPYCDRAKDYFNQKGIPFEEKNITKNPTLRKEMLDKSQGRRTVPEIFINAQLIGGWDDLTHLIQKGEIEVLLKSS